MTLELFAKSQRGLYCAEATYVDGAVTVKKGASINMNFGAGYKPAALVKQLFEDRSIVSAEGKLLQDTTFKSLSTAASFVAGRTSNGMMTWKTKDGKYVRETLKPKK